MNEGEGGRDQAGISRSSSKNTVNLYSPGGEGRRHVERPETASYDGKPRFTPRGAEALPSPRRKTLRRTLIGKWRSLPLYQRAGIVLVGIAGFATQMKADIDFNPFNNKDKVAVAEVTVTKASQTEIAAAQRARESAVGIRISMGTEGANAEVGETRAGVVVGNGLVATNRGDLVGEWGNVSGITVTGQNLASVGTDHISTVDGNGTAYIAIETDGQQLPATEIGENITVGGRASVISYDVNPENIEPSMYTGSIIDVSEKAGVVLLANAIGPNGEQTDISGNVITNNGFVVDGNGRVIGFRRDSKIASPAELKAEFGGIDISGLAKDQQVTVVTFNRLDKAEVADVQDRFALWKTKGIGFNEIVSQEILQWSGENANGETVQLNPNFRDLWRQFAEKVPFELTCVVGDHSYNRADTGEISDHSLGNGFDIGALGEESVSPESEAAQNFIDWVYQEIKNGNLSTITEIGVPVFPTGMTEEIVRGYDIRGEPYDEAVIEINGRTIKIVTNEDHHNHFHFGVRRESNPNRQSAAPGSILSLNPPNAPGTRLVAYPAKDEEREAA